MAGLLDYLMAINPPAQTQTNNLGQINWDTPNALQQFAGGLKGLANIQDKNLRDQNIIKLSNNPSALKLLYPELAMSGNDLPASVKIANAYKDALARGDTKYAASLRDFAKTEEKGVTVDANGNAIAKSGYAGALGDLSAGKERGLKGADLVMNPKIAGAEEEARILAQNKADKAKNYQATIDNSQYLLNKIDELAGNKEAGIPEHAGLNGILGLQKSVPDIPGSEASGARARLEEIGNQQFLQAYNNLRGTGQISNAEGDKATNAISRMKTAPNKKEFQEAAEDFRGVIKKALARANPENAPSSAGGMKSALEELQDAGTPRNTPPPIGFGGEGWSIKKK